MPSRRRFSKPLLIIAWLLATGVSAAFAFDAWKRVRGTVESGQPQIELDHVVRNFGAIADNGPLRASFRLRNAGTRRLILREKSPGCDCVTGDRPPVVVQPGESAQLTIVASAPLANGDFEHEVRYLTSDPDRPVMTLTVRARRESGKSLRKRFDSARP